MISKTLRSTTTLLLLLGAARSASVQAQTSPITAFSQVNTSGFGSRQNGYSWAMLWYNGALYVGTVRNFQCVTYETLQYYHQGQHYYTTQIDPCVPCTPNPYDLDLRAEIWRYAPASKTWTRVFQSPADLPIPNTQKTVARDIGFRDMMAFSEPDGKGGTVSALYVAGVSAREYIPTLPYPRILRSTDGVNFTPIPLNIQGIPTGVTIMGFRSMASYNGKFYVTGSTELLGEGLLLESTSPLSGNFRVVSPPGMQVYELASFNGYLYIGTADQTNGYSVWKTNATGPLPYALHPVVTQGAGRGPTMASVVSNHVFNGALYVGSSGWNPNPYPPSELIRIKPDDTWQVVVGNSRRDPATGAWKTPLSGLPDGFGNPFNTHIWRMHDHDGVLYAGTNDTAWWHRSTLSWIPGVAAGFGFDLYGSTDGAYYWTPITKTGFGVPANFGLRTLASSPYGLFAGSANECVGTQVFLGHDSSDLTVHALATPARMEAEAMGGSSLLSWAPSPDAQTYTIYRAAYRKVDYPVPSADGEPGTASLWAPEKFTKVGTTSKSFFQDSAGSQNGPSLYIVQANSASGDASGPSNVAIVRPSSQGATFGQAQAAVEGLAAKAGDADSGAPLLPLIEKARTSAKRKDLATARETLETLRRRLKVTTKKTLPQADVEDVEVLLSRLIRRIDLVQAGVLSSKVLEASR